MANSYAWPLLFLVWVAGCARSPDAPAPATPTVDADTVDAPNDANIIDAPNDADVLSRDAAVNGGRVDASAPADGATSLDDGSTRDGGSNQWTAVSFEGPTYLGSVNNSVACSQSYRTHGHQPEGPSDTRHPLFLYFVGTAFIPDHPGSRVDNPAAMAVTEAMARRGFVALSVEYDNTALAWLSDHVNQLACVFELDRSESMLARACDLPNVDCELGIATWGHSQGGVLADAAYNYDDRVRAVWTTGYGGDIDSMLPRNRFRSVNGESDASNSSAEALNRATGFPPDACLDQDLCLREDGSGWIRIRTRDLANPNEGEAGHCWFDRPTCNTAELRLEPNWVDPNSPHPWALEPNADWLTLTVQR